MGCRGGSLGGGAVVSVGGGGAGEGSADAGGAGGGGIDVWGVVEAPSLEEDATAERQCWRHGRGHALYRSNSVAVGVGQA
jgi:hypothetical protein